MMALPAAEIETMQRTLKPLRACLECGEPVAHDGEFCTTACRKAWNNRRAVRGAELYDLFMALRFERGAAKAVGVWTLLCRAASLYRGEDEKNRGGRRSWQRTATVLDRRPYLKAESMAFSFGRKAR